MKTIFISYSHQDEDWKERLVSHLRVLERQELCRLWHDRKIPLGNDWPPEIETALNEADVVIMMLSRNFLDSDFIRDQEMPRIKERREKEKLTVIPLFVKPSAWKMIPWLANLQGFPGNGIELSEMNESAADKELAALTEQLARDFSGERGGRENKKGGIKSKGGLLTPLPMENINFLGRKQELKLVREKLEQTRRVLLLNGMGGIGKTEVCKRFFLDHYREFAYAAWVDCGPGFKEAVVEALGGEDSFLIETLPQDTQDERFERIMDGLYGLDKEALLVVDNIENPDDGDLDKLKRLPRNVKVIANSRSVVKGFDTVGLDVLSTDCCVELFYEHYLGERDDTHVNQLVSLCGRHTLTVELLARTAWNAAMEVKELYDTLKQKGFNLNGVIPERVDTVWHDEREQKQFFGHMLTVFDLSGVTDEELGVLANLSVLPPDVPMADFCEWMKLDSKDVLNGLVNKGWLNRSGNMLLMHNVLQEVIRHRAVPGVKTCENVIVSLMWKLKLEPHDNPITKQRYVRFADALVGHMSENDNALAALANNLSLIYHEFANLSKALEFQVKTVEMVDEILDKKHPDLATSYNNLSLIYMDRGDLEKALEFQVKALNIREEVLDKTHPDLAQSYNNLSTIYKEKGDFEKALEFQLKTMEIVEHVLDKNHPSLALSYNNLSQIYQPMGDLEKALEFQVKALNIREEVLEKKHPDLAQSYNNLAVLYFDLKNYPRAAAYGEKATAILQHLFPNGHPDLDLYKRNLERIKQAMLGE